MQKADLSGLAVRLCREAGLGDPVALERLAGGKNNRVFRLPFGDGGSVVLKSYFHDPGDTRDRLSAEWSFLNYAWRKGVRAAPQPLASDPVEHLGLYSMLPGDKLAALDIDEAHVRAAADFVCDVNAPDRSIGHLALGSEACLSLDQHVATVDRRIARLQQIAEDAPHREAAQRLINGDLTCCWNDVKHGVRAGAAKAGLKMNEAIVATDVIASPSDYGFHNALIGEDGVLRFLDFEYAGRDDPAKLAGDFFGCPEIPTPPAEFGTFVDRMSDRLGLSPSAGVRAHLLRNAYRVKWACIILNDFLPTEDARRSFADQGEREQRCARQLAKAEAKLAEIA
ncbi:MAG: aminoglycoside phosphotransferase family protein [Alphaproteobacteria bacterium]|nr:aminoglycoside phosphotransferase family protein [Alphaproteobacteria bacterium]MDZ4762517.1 aminoglycoside phosphotransferase family protein [Alphaproteobacteria bacterium]